MAYKIRISKSAKKTYDANIDYLNQHGTAKEVIHFIKKTSEITNVLKQSPKVFQKWEVNSKIYRIPIVKQITLFYSIKQNAVEILLFWNNYQDPDKLLDCIK